GSPRHAEIVGADVAVVDNVRVVADGDSPAESIALYDTAVAGSLRPGRRSRGRVGHAAGVVGAAGGVLAVAVGAAVRIDQALDADALAIAEVAAAARRAGRDRRIRRHARAADVLGTRVLIIRDVGRIDDELHVAAAVALRDLAVSGRL